MSRRQTAVARAMGWFRDTQTPLFALNARQQIILFNAGCESATGWTATDVLSQRAEHVTEAEPHSIAALLAALACPPELWNGVPQTWPIDLPHRERTSAPRLIHGFPLQEAEGTTPIIVGIITPLPASLPTPALSLAQRLHAELASVRHHLRQRYGEKSLITQSPAMQRVLQQLKVAQGTTAPVLLSGERGVGKEHLARAIHLGSAVGRRPFVALDCRQTPPFEIKRVLRQAREEATRHSDSPLQPGSFYFDAIDAAPADVHERLTEWLAEPGPLPVRVLASCPSPLAELVTSGKIAQALAWQLSVLTIEVPPLRERPEDLGPLAQFFLEEMNRGAATQVVGYQETTWDELRKYHWPGNLDELAQVVQVARAATTGAYVLPEHLPFQFRSGQDAQTLGPPAERAALSLDALLEQVEREQLRWAIEAARNNMTRAAELLQIPRARLYRRMQQLGLAEGNP